MIIAKKAADCPKLSVFAHPAMELKGKPTSSKKSIELHDQNLAYASVASTDCECYVVIPSLRENYGFFAPIH